MKDIEKIEEYLITIGFVREQSGLVKRKSVDYSVCVNVLHAMNVKFFRLWITEYIGTSGVIFEKFDHDRRLTKKQAIEILKKKFATN